MSQGGRHGCQSALPCSLHRQRWTLLNEGMRPPQGCSDPMKVVSLEESERESEGPGPQPVVVAERTVLPAGDG